jgi:hypothetical protein
MICLSRAAKIWCVFTIAILGTVLVAFLVYPSWRLHSVAAGGNLAGAKVIAHRNIKFGILPIDAWRLKHAKGSFEHVLSHGHYWTIEPANSHEQKREMEKLFGLQPMSLDHYDLIVGDNRLIVERYLVSKDRTESFLVAFGYI